MGKKGKKISGNERGASLDLNKFKALMHLGSALKLPNDLEILRVWAAQAPRMVLQPPNFNAPPNMLFRVIIVMLPSARVLRYQSGCAAES